MIHVRLPDQKDRNLAFYLAMEEYLAGKFDTGDYFFVWRTGPSVIFGRNQQMEAEVNVPYCTSNDIRIFRRKSGGGCVYSDWGNLMHSCITTSGTEPVYTFEKYMQRIVLSLKRLGLDARVSGRNDIMIGDRKISGNAFHVMPRRCVLHGTLLYDVDLDAMVNAITPSAEKLARKGVASVRQRVMNIKEITNVDIDDLGEFIVKDLCESEIILSQEDIQQIEELSLEYMDESFIKGKYTIQ